MGKLKQAFLYICMFWAVATVGVLIFSIVKEYWGLLIAAFGSLVAMVTVVSIPEARKQKKYTPFMLYFLFMGCALMLWGSIFQFLGEADMKRSLPDFVILSFFILGLILLIYPRMDLKKKKLRCTVAVNAQCVSIATWTDEDSTKYCPTYEVYYAGQTYKLCDNFYTNLQKFQVGDYKELLINPDDPTDFYNEFTSKTSTTTATVAGVILTASAVFLFLYIHFGIG